MKPLLVIENAAEVPLGYLADVLSGSATEFELIRPYADDPVPGHQDRLGIISLGGAMGAYDVSDHPFLVDQQRLLADRVAAGIPMLGSVWAVSCLPTPWVAHHFAPVTPRPGSRPSSRTPPRRIRYFVNSTARCCPSTGTRGNRRRARRRCSRAPNTRRPFASARRWRFNATPR